MTNGYSRRIRSFLTVFARVAVFVYVFQIAALDHHSHASGAHESGGLHATHCHGDRSSCADAAVATSAVSTAPLVPAAPAAYRTSRFEALFASLEASILTPTEPPRAG